MNNRSQKDTNITSNLLRFFVHCVASMHAGSSFRVRGLYFSENTTNIAIGTKGMEQLDDARAYKTLWDSLRESMENTADCIKWMLVAHTLVRPGIIERLRNMVCAQAIEPTKGAISKVMTVLTRRYGLVLSRVAVNERDWRKIDVFALASTVPMGSHYCGSKNMYQQLQQWDRFEKVATGIMNLSLETKEVAFSKLVSAIDGPRLTGYAPKGYWSVSLARVFDPGFCGVSLIKKMVFTQKCCEIVHDMGAGAQSMVDMGVRREYAREDMKKLADVIVKLNKTYGHETVINPGHLACAVCESHRRRGDDGGIERRKGL